MISEWLYKAGLFQGKAILTVFFFAVIVPVAWVRRLFVRDPLNLRWNPTATTYRRVVRSCLKMERQF